MTADYFSPDNVLVVTFGEDPETDKNGAPGNQGYELRCYLRDPDGRIIELGQATGFLEDLDRLKVT